VVVAERGADSKMAVVRFAVFRWLWRNCIFIARVRCLMLGLNGNIGPCGESEVKMVMMVVYGESLVVKLAMGDLLLKMYEPVAHFY
jgi:hypothetical protein